MVKDSSAGWSASPLLALPRGPMHQEDGTREAHPGNSTAPDSREEVTGHRCQSVGCSVVPDSVRPPGLQRARLLCPWDSPGKNTGVDSHSFLQGIFPTQRSSPGLLHCRQILYHLSHQGSPLFYTLLYTKLFNLPSMTVRGN